MNFSQPNVGVYFWKPTDEFGQCVVDSFSTLGATPKIITNESHLKEEALDIIFIYGPWGSLEPLFRILETLDSDSRPKVVLWQSEQFPNPAWPAYLWRLIGYARSYIESLAYGSNGSSKIILKKHYAPLVSRMNRFRYFGDIIRYSRSGLLNLVAMWSDVNADLLETRGGVNSIVAYMGGNELCGRDLGLRRDIPVLWLGKIGSDRRRKILSRIRKNLSSQGIELMVIDGVENPYLFGEERTALLNRTKVVLNLVREEWDNTSMRFFLGAANRCLVISEPVLDHIPFVPGIHYIQAPINEIHRSINQYLDDKQKRTEITENAFNLINNELTTKKSLRKILKHLEENAN